MNASKSVAGYRQKLVKVWMASRKWIVVGIGTVVVGLLLMVFAGVFTEKVSETELSPTRQLESGWTAVEAKLLRQPRFESAVGSIEPIHQSSVASKILAKVAEVRVSAGQQVEAGEVLVRLNDDDLQSRLKQAEASLSAARAHAEQAQLDLARAKRLIELRAVSQAELEAASTNARSSEAEVEQALRTVEEAHVVLDYATITAPFGGIVIDKNVQAGDTVTPGQPLLTLYDPTQMQLVVNVRESLAMDLQVGQQVPAKLEALDYECPATVREIVPQAEAGSRSFQVKVSGPCPPGIYSGMFGRVLLPLEDEELLVIPAAALRRVGQLTLVDVVIDGRLERRSVQLGRELKDQVEVLAGLRAGEKVAVPAAAQGAA